MEPRVDLHRQAKSVFASKIAAYLEDAAGEDKFDSIVLVAPPQMLGDLRSAIGKQTVKKVSGELDKDLTHFDEAALAEHLKPLMAG